MLCDHVVLHLPLTSSTVLNTLKLFNLILRQAVKKRVATIQLACNKCMDKGLCTFLREESSNASNVSYMMKGGVTDGCHPFLKVK